MKEAKASETPNNLYTPELQLLSQSKISSIVLTPSKFLPSIKSEKNRIGILRRSEGILPSSESNALIAQTPTLANIKHITQISNADCSPLPAHLSQSKRPLRLRNEPSQNESSPYDIGLKAPDTIPLKSTLFDELAANEEQHWNQNEANLDEFAVSDDGRENNGYFEQENRRNDQISTTPKKEIPFWLRPTPVQPYPYNFIMAVRKKLESITHPVFQTNKQYQTVAKKQTSPYRSPVARPGTKFVSKFQRNLNRRTSESDSMSENAKSSVSPLKSKTLNDVKYSEEQQDHENDEDEDEEQEEYSMNFSSVTRESIHQRSHNHSKSKRKSIRASQDTLSISSGILSHSSPEKKMKTTTTSGTNVQDVDEQRQPSPLTTDNVDGLQITSHSSSQVEQVSREKSTNHSVQSMQSMQSVHSTQPSTHSSQSSIRSMIHSTQNSSVKSYLNFRRGKDYSPSKQPSLNKLTKQKNVEELLRDFRDSLSQVIEVNQRLHTMLSNPPSSRGSKYSDDFENATDNRQTEISEHISGTRDSTSVPSYKTQHSFSERHGFQSNGHYINDKNGESTEMDRDETVPSNTLTGDRVSEQISGLISNELSILSSTRNPIKNTYSIEESQVNESRNITEPSSNVEKESSTLIEEKIHDYQSSESPTNNDLKSVSLSIAKKSVATSDDTDQPSNAIETFTKEITGEPDVANESIGSDIFTVFNKTSMNVVDDANASIWSEHNISYSTLGMVIFVGIFVYSFSSILYDFWLLYIE